MTADNPQFVHVIANIDLEEGKGKILYVTPSNIRSGIEKEEATGKVSLVLKNAEDEEIKRIYPHLRIQGCDEEHDNHQALIQEDIKWQENITKLVMMLEDQVIDIFVAGSENDETTNEGLAFSLGMPSPGLGNKRALGANTSVTKPGFTYTIQVKPDNAHHWTTLSVGQPCPNFEIDKNQFPDAHILEVKINENRGFSQKVVDTRTISLDE